MNKSHHYFFLLLLIAVIGCNSLKDSAIIGIPITFEEQFEVFTDTVEAYTFIENKIIDATQNGDVAESIDNIKDYQIKSIRYLISNIDTEGDSVITQGIISFSNVDVASEIIVFTQENINLDELDTPSEEQEIEYTNEQLIALGEMLKSGNQIKIVYAADIDTVASYTYKVIIDISLKVGI